METNPAAEMKPPAAAIKRDRVLEDHEVKAFWEAASDVSWPFASIYKLLLLTGARREEVAGMRWSELDLDAGLRFFPSARTKNKRDHRIPLSRQAIDLLDRLGILQQSKQASDTRTAILFSALRDIAHRPASRRQRRRSTPR